MTAWEAKAYGIIDDVVAPRRGVSVADIEAVERESADAAPAATALA